MEILNIMTSNMSLSYFLKQHIEFKSIGRDTEQRSGLTAVLMANQQTALTGKQ